MNLRLTAALAAVFITALLFETFAVPACAQGAPGGGTVLVAFAQGADVKSDAVRALNARDFDRAIRLLEDASANDPFDDGLKDLLSVAYDARGWSRVNANELDEGFEDFRKASVVETKKRAETYLGLGFVSFRQGNNDDALYYLYDAVYIDPEDGHGHEIIGEIYYKRGKLRDAISEWETSLALDPENPGLERRLAKARKELDVEGSFTKRETYYFNIKYEGGERRDLGDQVLDILDRAYLDVGGDLDFFPKEPVTVILYTRKQFTDLTDAPSWSGGVFDGSIRIPVGGEHIDNDALAAVLYHEYTHAVLRMVAGNSVPTWLEEGIAQYEERWARKPAAHLGGAKLIPLSSLDRPFMQIGDPEKARLAYAQSLSAVEFFVARFGEYSLSKLVRLLGNGTGLKAAMQQTAGVSLTDFEDYWHSSLGR